MKRTISVLLVLAMMLATVLAIVPASAAEGTAITDEAGFLAMDDSGEYYLANDIELTQPYAQSNFKGTFDGNNKNITLNGAKGCFNEIEGATIKNLTVKGDVIIASGDAGAVSVYGDGTLINCKSQVNVTVTTEGTAQYVGKVGGMIAVVNGETTITDCSNSGTITITSGGDQKDHYIGGMVGCTEGSKMADKRLVISNCTNTGAISSTQACAYLGGMIGYCMNTALEMDGCTNGGRISVKQGPMSNVNGSYTGLGGMIGGTHQGGSNSGLSVLLTNCTNNAVIEGTNTEAETVSCLFIGGMIGRGLHNNNFRAIDCVNTGNITVPKHDRGWSGAGGMIGCMMTIGMTWAGAFDGKGNGDGETIMENCKNTGVITSKNAGGMWGSVYQMFLNDQVIKLQYCVNEGAINGTETAGGLIGYFGGAETVASDITIKNCLNKGNVTATARAAGVVAYIDKIGTKAIPTIDSCVNLATIKTTSTSSDAGAGIAAGILGYMPGFTFEASTTENHVVSATTTAAMIEIKNCVVGGSIVKEANNNDRVAITLTNNGISTNTSAPNYYLSGIAPNVDFGTAKSSTEITNLANAIKTSVTSVGKLQSAISKASGFLEIDYTANTWSAYTAALAAAKEALTNYESLSQNDVDGKATALTNAINGLTYAPLDTAEIDAKIAEAEGLTKADYTSISFLRVTNALADAKAALDQEKQSVVNEALAALVNALDRLDAKSTGGSTNDGGDNNDGATNDGATNNGATNNGGTTNAATDAPAASDAAEEEGGCGSAISAAAVVLTTVLALGTGVAFKKKED